MKKFTYLVIATAALSIAACTGQKNGYVITGTAEGAADGGYRLSSGKNR